MNGMPRGPARIPHGIDPFTLHDPQPAPTAYERNRARRRKRRNVVIVFNIIFWSSAIAGALIQWMPQ